MKTLRYMLGAILLSPWLLMAQPQQNFLTDYSLLRQTFKERNAFETVAFVESRWRLAGNSGFNESIWYVENILKQGGFQKEVNGETDSPLTYRIETRKRNKPTWEPIDASLTIEGTPEPLLQFNHNRNMIAINSTSANVVAEIINIGNGRKGDWENVDVKGKIVFAEASPYAFYKTAMEKGAIGILAYSVPAYNKPEVNQNSISFQGIPYQDSVSQRWALLLSYSAKEKLKAALAKGIVRTKVNIKTKIYRSDELTLVANIRGSTLPKERFVFSAHVQEPGANDNASGVGTLAEMARAAAELFRNNTIKPHRTITFLWGDEIISTKRYIQDDPDRAKGIKWGLSLDMVGEDVTKTGGTFLIEKMPDPTAIWTRGEEKHSEWGGEPLTEKDLFPHYFNDFIQNRCVQQGRDNGWMVKTNPFEGGSDHTPFLEAKIPGLLMWHFTDVFYHVDGDRLENVSANEMKNVGVSALASAIILTTADEKTTIELINEVKQNALVRLQTEFELSRKAIAEGSKRPAEQHILDVWTSYYKRTFEKMIEIPVAGKTKFIENTINNAIRLVESKREELNNLLLK